MSQNNKLKTKHKFRSGFGMSLISAVIKNQGSTVTELAADLDVNYSKVKYWMRKLLNIGYVYSDPPINNKGGVKYYYPTNFVLEHWP